MKDYLYIRAWGSMMGSGSGYTERQVEQAREAGAPQDVIYYSDIDKKWFRVEDIRLMENRDEIESIVKELQHENT